METKIKSLSLGFNAKVKPIEKINEEFTRTKIFIQGVGKNRNGSVMTKESIERNLSTLPYCPIVGHLYQNSEGEWIMGGHDSEIVVTDGGIEVKDLTVPYGVVCDKEFQYETIDEYGKDVEYLVGEGILWTGRYPVLKEAIYSDDFWFNQSVELSVKQYRDYEEDSNYIELLEWDYSAACLLGKAEDKNSEAHTEPCFINAHVEPIKFSFNEDFANAFSEMKEKLAVCFENNEIQEGGDQGLDNELIVSILAEYELTLEDIDFEISNDMTEENLREKAEAFARQKKRKCALEKFAATYNQKRDALRNILDYEYEYNGEDLVSSTSYWICDFDDEFVYVERDKWDYKGNWESNAGRFSYTFNEKTMTATRTSEFEPMIVKWLTIEENEKLELSRNVFSELQIEFDEYKEKYSTPNDEVNELVKFKEDVIAERREVDEAALFEQFDKELGDIDEYKTLKADCKEMSLDEISDRCFSILGKKVAKFSFSKVKSKTAKVPVSNPELDSTEDDAPYGGVQKKYLKKR